MAGAGCTSLLLLLLTSVAARKCCPDREVLNAHLMCVPWYKDVLLADDDENGMPDCDTNRKLVHPTEDNLVDCIDIIIDNDDNGHLTGVVCESSNETFHVPSVDSIRKCCPTYRRYTDYMDGCWSGNIKDDENVLNTLLKHMLNHTDGFINLSIGAPKCANKNNVLVDIKLDYRMIYRQESESVLLKIPTKPDLLLTPDDVCFDLTNDDDYMVVIRACQDDKVVCNIEKKPCIRKCCPDGEAITQIGVCSAVKNRFQPRYYQRNDKQIIPYGDIVTPAIAYGADICKNGKYILNPAADPDDAYYLQNNGRLFVPLFNDDYYIDSYCMENVLMETHSYNGIFPFLCFPNAPTKLPVEIKYYIMPIGMTSSAVFLLITFLVYCCLSSLQNLHGKTLMCHVFSLLGAYVSLITAQLGSKVLPPLLCYASGFGILFWFMAAFSWLNVLCFDIWWTFGAVRSPFIKKQTSHRFLFYSLYAWGVPCIITVLAGLADMLKFLSYRFRPNFAVKYCWFDKEHSAILIFFFIPVTVLMIPNLILFILTARYCSKIKSELQNIQNNGNAKLKYKADRTKFLMNVKLFFVMGMSWSCECISWYIQNPPEIWYLSDLANILQGVLIFLIFVMKKKVIRAIKHQLSNLFHCGTKKEAHRPSASTIFTTASDSRTSSSLNKRPH